MRNMFLALLTSGVCLFCVLGPADGSDLRGCAGRRRYRHGSCGLSGDVKLTPSVEGAFCRHEGDFIEQQFATLGYHGG